MGTVAEFFRTAGPGAYLLLMLLLMAMPMSTVGTLLLLFSKRRGYLLIAGVLCLLLFGAMVLVFAGSWAYESNQITQVMQVATPENKPRLMERYQQGVRGKMVFFAICVAVIAPGCFAFFKGLLQPKVK